MSAETRPIVIGVAGGTGSGKTTVAHAILEKVGWNRIAFIQHDSYYYDASNLPMAERARLLARPNAAQDLAAACRPYLQGAA